MQLPLPPAAATCQAEEIAFDLVPGNLAPGELHDLLHLFGRGGEVLADLAARGGGGLLLATPRGGLETGPGLATGRRHHFVVRYDRARGLASARLVGPAESPGYLAEPAAVELGPLRRPPPGLATWPSPDGGGHLFRGERGPTPPTRRLAAP
jgi:hypothetical protein